MSAIYLYIILKLCNFKNYYYEKITKFVLYNIK